MSESALMRGVRGAIRSSASFEDRQVNVELDERAPATVGNVYVIIMTGGVEPGPSYVSGRTKDLIYGVDVSVAIRSPRKPRDRSRDLWIETTKSFETYRQAIDDKVDFSYDVLTNATYGANFWMIAEGEATGSLPYGDCDTFIEPLQFAGMGPFRMAPAEIFAGFQGEPAAAVIRTIRYRGARRLETR